MSSPYREPRCLGDGCRGRRVLARSESADLERLAGLVARVLHVPIAYVNVSQPAGQPPFRIGLGTEHWEEIETLPSARELVSPVVIQEPFAEDPESDLNFAALAPLDTLCGKRLGTLVIADRAERPVFSAQDLAVFTDLAGIIADRIEMRMISAQASPALIRPYDVSNASQGGTPLPWS